MKKELADKARELEPNLSQIDGTRKYYGVDNNDGEMKLRTFPAGTHTEHVDTYVFDNLTKDVPQTIPFVEERPEVNVIPTVFKFREGLKNQENIIGYILGYIFRSLEAGVIDIKSE